MVKDKGIVPVSDITGAEKESIFNPVVRIMEDVMRRVFRFKDLAREYYYEVVLMRHSCPMCGDRLKMTGQSECSCRCGQVIDPTTEFQRSDCCGAKVIKKVLHYACSCCGGNVPSVFLFDERIFDSEYFKEAMRTSRERRQQKREEIRRMLAASRSEALHLTEPILLDDIPGLKLALDEFIGSMEEMNIGDFREGIPFQMKMYRDLVLSYIEDCNVYFSAIAPLCDDLRVDRVQRFITLIYMQQDCEVELTQCDNDILVGKYEAYD